MNKIKAKETDWVLMVERAIKEREEHPEYFNVKEACPYSCECHKI